jgi:hypothetical protein
MLFCFREMCSRLFGNEGLWKIFSATEDEFSGKFTLSHNEKCHHIRVLLGRGGSI